MIATHVQTVSDRLLRAQCREAWIEYALQRFDMGSDRELAMRDLLEGRCASEYDRLRKGAQRVGDALDFPALRLRLLAIEALGQACTYCSRIFGVDALAVVWDVQPKFATAPRYGLRNVVACCSRCAQAKGTLPGSVWLDVVAALRTAEPSSTAEETIDALIVGRQAHHEGRRYSLGGAVCG